jgi:hypothetical protein
MVPRPANKDIEIVSGLKMRALECARPGGTRTRINLPAKQRHALYVGWQQIPYPLISFRKPIFILQRPLTYREQITLSLDADENKSIRGAGRAGVKQLLSLKQIIAYAFANIGNIQKTKFEGASLAVMHGKRIN